MGSPAELSLNRHQCVETPRMIVRSDSQEFRTARTGPISHSVKECSWGRQMPAQPRPETHRPGGNRHAAHSVEQGDRH